MVLFNPKNQEEINDELMMQERQRMTLERALIREFVKEFRRLSKSVIPAFKKDNSGRSSVVATELRHEENIEKILRKTSDAHTSRVIGRTLREFNRKDFRQDLQETMQKWVARQSTKRAKQIARTTRKGVWQVIRRGNKANLSPEEIAKKLENYLAGRQARLRSKTIARTESHTLNQTIQFLTVKNLGIKGIRKEWVTMHDEKVRETHDEVDGKKPWINQPFIVGDFPMMYPGDPKGPPQEIINCRCVLVYHTVNRLAEGKV